MKTIIFDFNRTLYNPDVDRLLPEARRVLDGFRRRGYQLYLVSRKEPARDKLIEELGLAVYFRKVYTVSRKSKRLFASIVKESGSTANEVAVIGDRISEEIAIANALGLTSIRLRAGKFAREEPASDLQIPTYTVEYLRQLAAIIR